jgi:16S rRNA (guanine(966)-N(2))-methyltransferase RsmD
MIKVSGGIYRSRILATPPTGTVPTKAIVREAMANALQDKIPGADVLDLFAGSGALGIEALSRGAKSCVFVDEAPEAVSVIKGNLASLKEKRGEVIQADFAEGLRLLGGRSFDIVFLDPPYALKDLYATLPARLLEGLYLKPGAAVALEYEGTIEAPKSRFSSFREYNYGRTHVLILRR